MSECVLISSRGLHTRVYVSSEERWVWRRVRKLRVLRELRNRCRIAPGTTLLDIFSAVGSYSLLSLFISDYCWCDVRAFHEEARRVVTPEIKTMADAPRMSKLVVQWVASSEAAVEKRRHPGGTRERLIAVGYDASSDFVGIAESGASAEAPPVRYSLSMTPVYELVDLPVVLEESFDIYAPLMRGRHGPTELPQKLLTHRRAFTLLDVLDAVYYEISFHGSPDDRDAMRETLKERLDEIRGGGVAGIPIEQVRKQLGMPPYKGDQAENTELKIVFHPDAARALGVDPDKIPLDDKEIMKPGGE